MIAPLLKLNNVSKSYLTAGGSEELRILHGINLALNRGESLAILGPSGSGKSTLLNIIGTLDRPTNGEVIFDGEDVGRLDDIALARVRNAKIGFIFQAHHLLPQCTVLENVLVPTLASTDKGLRGSAPDRARKLLDRVGLQNRLEHRPGQLSGGERQRVAVVRALINEPKLLLADEPTGALDQSSAHNLAQLLTEINREQNLTLILVTHAIDLAARMKRQVEIQNGTLVSK
jgi:ABC-type lipoprotein export system ATPase subunit